MALAKCKKPVRPVVLNVTVHPEVRRALKGRAVAEGISMVECFHRIACQSLNRLDLITAVPKTTDVSWKQPSRS